MTSPRRATNQRVDTVATKARAIEPVPSPTSSPQHRISCQLAVIHTVSPLPMDDEREGAGDDEAHPEALHQRRGERVP